MSRLWPFAAAALLALACSDATGPGSPQELRTARARWNEHGGLDYSFELTRGCFCVLGGRRIRVTVADGAVAAAQYLDSGGAVEHSFLLYLPTVPDLFDLIEDALARQPAVLEVSYDPFDGHPARIAVDYSATAIDDEVTLTVRSLLVEQALGRRR